MRFTPEIIAEDEKRWHARDVVTELRYCSEYMPDRKNMTNLDMRFYAYLMRKAHEMLRDREPRLMQFDEIIGIYNSNPSHVWPYTTPPFLFVQELTRNSIGSWVAWREIKGIIEDGLFGHTAQSYGKTWCCWTADPTKEKSWKEDEVEVEDDEEAQT